MTTIHLEEGQRQVLLLALAELSLRNPGWLNATEEIALLMDTAVDGKAAMFEAFRRTRSDPVARVLADGPEPLDPAYPPQCWP